MSRFNVCVQLFANVTVNGPSRDGAEAIINKFLEDEAIFKIGAAEFVIEGGDVTGVFDVDWNELESTPAGITPIAGDGAMPPCITAVCPKCGETFSEFVE